MFVGYAAGRRGRPLGRNKPAPLLLASPAWGATEWGLRQRAYVIRIVSGGGGPLETSHEWIGRRGWHKAPRHWRRIRPSWRWRRARRRRRDNPGQDSRVDHWRLHIDALKSLPWI